MKLRNYLEKFGITSIQFNKTNSGRQVINLEDGDVTIFTKKDAKPNADHYMVRVRPEGADPNVKIFVLTEKLPQLGDVVTL